MNHEYLFPALATMVALSVYYSQAIFVALSRNKHGIKPPRTTGNEDFERAFRVHYNTLEQLPLLLFPLWFFAFLVSSYWAGWLGIMWSIGRIGYMYGYYKGAETRHSYGSIISYIAWIILVVGSFWEILGGMIR